VAVILGLLVTLKAGGKVSERERGRLATAVARRSLRAARGARARADAARRATEEIYEQLVELARLLQAFESLSSDVIAETPGKVVKLIGDEVMFVCPDGLLSSSSVVDTPAG
jgi:hypothetical protein